MTNKYMFNDFTNIVPWSRINAMAMLLFPLDCKKCFMLSGNFVIDIAGSEMPRPAAEDATGTGG